MRYGISSTAKKEIIEATKERYLSASKQDKTIILDELVSLTGNHRKHVIRALSGVKRKTTLKEANRRIYDEAVKEALLVLWEASSYKSSHSEPC